MFLGRCLRVSGWGGCCCRALMRYPIKKENRKKDRDKYWEGDMKIWEGKMGRERKSYTELAVCSKTREQTPQSHSANPSRQHWSLIISTPPSAVHTTTHTFHSLPDSPHPPTRSFSPMLKGERDKTNRRWRKVRRDKGGRKERKEQLRFTPWAMRQCRRWVPESPPPPPDYYNN